MHVWFITLKHTQRINQYKTDNLLDKIRMNEITFTGKFGSNNISLVSCFWLKLTLQEVNSKKSYKLVKKVEKINKVNKNRNSKHC